MAGSNFSVILTGASEGIGRAMAIEFASRGFRLGLIARRKELLEEVKQQCLKAGSPEVFFESVDVGIEDLFAKSLHQLDEQLGGADFFIANAGVLGRSNFEDNAWETVKHTLHINVFAAIHGLEIMKLKMLKRGRGSLVGVSSIAGARGMPTSGAYSTSKAALTTHLETMRVDLKSCGIAVTTIAPGFIATPMTAHNKGTMPFLSTPDKAAKVFVDAVIQKKSWIVFPYPYRVMYPILQMLPRSIFDFLMNRAYKSIRG